MREEDPCLCRCVCVCMCVCTCVCTCVCACVYVCAHVYVCMCVYVCACVHACVCVCSDVAYHTLFSPHIQENAEAARRILEDYEKSNPSSSNHKDLHYNFPPGLFNSEVDLEGSQMAYQYLLQGLDRPNDFQQLLVQVEANPMHSQNMFGDINFDIFD